MGIAAISYDSPKILRDFAKRQKISLPLISDPGSKAIRAWGLINESYKDRPDRYGIPHPGVFILDSNGVIIEKHFEESHRERQSASGIVVAEIDLPGDSIEIATDQFRVETFPSSPEVFPGHRIGLVLEFEMGENLHAYAPGEHTYRPLNVTLEPSSLIRVDELIRPESTMYHFEPFDETVQAYEGSFRLVQEVTLLVNDEVREIMSSDDRTIEIQATLSYQVCSDSVCYPPDEADVRWRFDVRPLEMERVPEELQKK